MSGSPNVFLGVATLDAIALVDAMPAPNERRVVEDLAYAGGGPAATAAVAAARLGLPDVFFAGLVGADDEGERVLAELADEGVDVSGVLRSPGVRTGASVVVVDRTRGTRAICNRPVPPLRVDAGSVAADLLASAGWLHVDQLGWPVVAPLIARERLRARLSVDAGNAIPGYDPRGVEVDVPTAEALLERYPGVELDAAVDRALQAGARRVVVTLGAAGSLGRTERGERAEVPGARVDVVSTLGAGDVFHGGLLAALVREEPLPRALAYANAAAALSCRGLDGRSAIPSHAEASALAATLLEGSPCPTP